MPMATILRLAAPMVRLLAQLAIPQSGDLSL